MQHLSESPQYQVVKLTCVEKEFTVIGLRFLRNFLDTWLNII
jgi:hypothetical protein